MEDTNEKKGVLPNVKPGETLPFYGDAHTKTPEQWKDEVRKANKKWAKEDKKRGK